MGRGEGKVVEMMSDGPVWRDGDAWKGQRGDSVTVHRSKERTRSSQQTRSVFSYRLLQFFISVILGAAIFRSLRNTASSCNSDVSASRLAGDDVIASRQLMFVGVMTARELVTSRALTVWRTWARTIPGQVVFFSSEGTALPDHPDIPIISLPGVNDDYPPQKKSFIMLKYMYERWGKDYEWFLRVDDDAYINAPNLVKLLRSLNSSQPLYLGQPGQGKKEEFGKLHLSGQDNFCMGGPGMVLSHTTLKRVAPNVADCLRHLYSTHEDTEVGRCIHKYAGVRCTWNYEMREVFLNNYVNKTSPLYNFGAIERGVLAKAATFHPIKDVAYMYSLQSKLITDEIRQLRKKQVSLQQELSNIQHYMGQKYDNAQPEDWKYNSRTGQPEKPLSDRENVKQWEFMSSTQIMSPSNLNPRRRFEAPLAAAVERILVDFLSITNEGAYLKGRTVAFDNLNSAYRNAHPLHGVSYQLDINLKFRRHSGKKGVVKRRRHVHLRQKFTKPTIRVNLLEYPENSAADEKSKREPSDVLQWVQNMMPAGRVVHQTIVHLIVTIAGRLETFLRFMQQVERECLAQGDRVSLTVVIFHDREGRTSEATDYVIDVARRYPDYVIGVKHMKGPFSRGRGLQAGITHLPNTTLVMFLDVDILFSRQALQRVRENTRIGEQVNYPVVFSQYDPDIACLEVDNCATQSNQFSVSEQLGYWRQFGFGIVSMYKQDFVRVGGFDDTIEGWGKEDVNLYERFMRHNLSVFRSADPGLIHVFHPITCDPGLTEAQMNMCRGSSWTVAGSIDHLASLLVKNDVMAKIQRLKEEEYDGKKMRRNEIADQTLN